MPLANSPAVAGGRPAENKVNYAKERVELRWLNSPKTIWIGSSPNGSGSSVSEFLGVSGSARENPDSPMLHRATLHATVERLSPINPRRRRAPKERTADLVSHAPEAKRILGFLKGQVEAADGSLLEEDAKLEAMFYGDEAS